MLEDGEFPKLIDHAPNTSEKKKVAKDYDAICSIVAHTDIEDFPIIPLISGLSSVETFKDIITYMLIVENKLLMAEKKIKEGGKE